LLKDLSMSLRGSFSCTPTDLALASRAHVEGRPVDALDAGDRKIIGAVIRALQRLLEDDGVAPALQEDQRARVMVHDGKVLLLAAVSTPSALARTDDELATRPGAPIYRLPPLQTRTRRSFAFG
jgi:hypothetical protein